MPVDGPRLTEERLRNHLDSNQAMRERMCLALLPLLGPYTREKPRRPKGGPDGGRDIEAIFEGTAVAWAAVGFRNGGGRDTEARNDACGKFRSDLARALSECPSLSVFVFFTNVDLTPAICEELKLEAAAKGVTHVDVIDIERLRHALDSPEGLIARLQYLDIPMTATEQIALVSKFGSQLQNAVLSRFDRVERTLENMERFLDWQKPLARLDLYVQIKRPMTSSEVGDGALCFELDGLEDLGKRLTVLVRNQTIHAHASSRLVSWTHLWRNDSPNKAVSLVPSLGSSDMTFASYGIISLTTGGHRVRLGDLSVVRLWVTGAGGLASEATRVAVDINGYELFNCDVHRGGRADPPAVPQEVPALMQCSEWMTMVDGTRRDLMWSPLARSGRLCRLVDA